MKIAKIQKTDTTKCWRGCRATGTGFIAGWNTKWYSRSGSKFGSFSTKLNIVSPHNAAITLLGIYPKQLKSYVHTKISVHRCLPQGGKKKAPSKFKTKSVLLIWVWGSNLHYT